MVRIFLSSLALSSFLIIPGFAQDSEAPVPDAPSPTPVTITSTESAMELVTVDWLEEMIQGGVTMVALGLLSVAMLAFAVERFIVLKTKHFIPPGLAEKVEPWFLGGYYDNIIAECNRHPSTLARVITYLVDHRHTDPGLLAQNAGDMAGRDIVDQEQRTTPFAVIAAMAPLLGLLGTMIGMIEAFKLVEVFGDEGGASMLAGSISKALITTAVGLILAIPAIGLYHYFKHRLHKITKELEIRIEKLMSVWFLRTRPIVQAVPSVVAVETEAVAYDDSIYVEPIEEQA